MTEPKFKIGDPVYKKTGSYKFPGEIRAVFTTKRGDIRYVVECITPEVAGILHIFNESNLGARYLADRRAIDTSGLLKAGP